MSFKIAHFPFNTDNYDVDVQVQLILAKSCFIDIFFRIQKPV